MRIESLIWNNPHPVRFTSREGLSGTETLQAQTASVLRALAEGNVQRGDRIILLAENGLAFICGLFGILSSGAIAVPVDPGIPAKSIPAILQSTGAKIILYAGERAANTVLKTEVRTACIDLQNLAIQTGSPMKIPEQFPDTDPALLLFSSGTTGTPKGILLSHKAIMQNVSAISAYIKPHTGDTFYIAKTMVHGSTLTGELFTALQNGSAIFAPDIHLSPAALFRKLAESEASILCIPPSLLHFFTASFVKPEKLSALRILHVSGSIINRSAYRKAAALMPRLRIINGYGLTEAGPRIAQTDNLKAGRFGSVGKAIEGVRIEVRRKDGITSCGHFEQGEVYVSSPSLMEGYWKNGELDNSAVKTGWLATGDEGYLDESDELVITGRTDDQIITGAHNVSPADIEEIILQQEGIADCLVFGIPDELLGQRIVCGYISETNATDDPATVEQALRKQCSEQLADYQAPKNYYRWTEMPLNANGKKSRRMAQEKYTKQVPLISVILPVHNQLQSLLTVLRFFNYQHHHSYPFELIVVDDGSAEPVASFIQNESYRFRLTVLTQANSGRAAARNKGVAHANGSLLIFCDADRIPAPDFVEQHAVFHEKHQHAAAFGASWDCFLGEEKLQAAELSMLPEIRRFSRKPAYYKNITQLFENGESNSAISWAAFLVGNSSLRKTDFEKAGGFDESFRTWGFEHFDLAIRLLEKGIRIANLDAAANFHIPHKREDGFFENHIQSGSLLLAEKHPFINRTAFEKFLLGETDLKNFEESAMKNSGQVRQVS